MRCDETHFVFRLRSRCGAKHSLSQSPKPKAWILTLCRVMLLELYLSVIMSNSRSLRKDNIGFYPRGQLFRHNALRTVRTGRQLVVLIHLSSRECPWEAFVTCASPKLKVLNTSGTRNKLRLIVGCRTTLKWGKILFQPRAPYL